MFPIFFMRREREWNLAALQHAEGMVLKGRKGVKCFGHCKNKKTAEKIEKEASRLVPEVKIHIKDFVLYPLSEKGN